jgi:hypothetical protein
MTRQHGRRNRPVPRPKRGSTDPADASLRYLMYVLLPAWFVPGVVDWWMHRRTRIERTSGLPESLIHALMMTEVGVPVLLRFSWRSTRRCWHCPTARSCCTACAS